MRTALQQYVRARLDGLPARFPAKPKQPYAYKGRPGRWKLMGKTLEERFWLNVTKTDTGCWLWAGCLATWMAEGVKRNPVNWAYEHFRGPVPMMLPYHGLQPSCGNEKCVNPDHLKPVKWVRPCKITDTVVEAIRQDARPYPVMAQDYGVSVSMICMIRGGKRRAGSCPVEESVKNTAATAAPMEKEEMSMQVVTDSAQRKVAGAVQSFAKGPQSVPKIVPGMDVSVLMAAAIIQTRVRTVTMNVGPELASQWLEQCNISNRKPLDSTIDHYGRMLKDNQWKLSGEAISFDTNGRLVNGQNRLMAIVRTGCAMPVLVVFGLDPDAFPVIDTGRNRDRSTPQQMKGEKSARHLVSITQMIWRSMRGVSLWNKTYRITDQEVDETLAKYPQIRDSVTAGTRLQQITSVMVAGYCHFMFSRENAGAATEFFEGLRTGLDPDGKGYPAVHPILRLRDRLVRNGVSRSKLGSEYILNMFVKAWQMHLNGLRATRLRTRRKAA